MYILTEIDLAGNSVPVHEAETFNLICEAAVAAKRIRPQNIYNIYNSETADIDTDGLTDEEREMLP